MMQQEVRIHLTKRNGSADTFYQLVLLSAAILSILLQA